MKNLEFIVVINHSKRLVKNFLWSKKRFTSREGAGWAGSSNYTVNRACFIDCERARAVTKPCRVYLVRLKGGRVEGAERSSCHSGSLTPRHGESQ